MQIVAKPSADMGDEASGKASVVLPPPLGMSSLIAAATAVPPVDHVCHKAEIRAKKESKRIKKENNTVYKKPAAKVVGGGSAGCAAAATLAERHETLLVCSFHLVVEAKELRHRRLHR